ncbi:MAG: hypothetical protein CEN91_303 [Candidatus Berkelbacteria bacterium Licking1014_85]|uniref:Uncharacterized protein n=1 Tax=Candidatus Berkelbacteria bacterium Licking1014_85 TaxID=2017148 RepID=A0A554LJN9_9BACT|nr:MAG: hypothetical protein CEN91_303 [Candidatus Berkelbacteria bacterium Licking1014_85]
MTSQAKIWLAVLLPIIILGSIGITYLIIKNAKSSADITVVPNETASIQTTAPIISNPITTTSVSDSTLKITFKSGWNLIGIPYFLSPNEGKSVFSGVLAKEVLSIQDGEWKSIIDSGSISPGQGIWVNSELGEVFEIPVDAKDVPIDKSFTIRLTKGDNYLANPFAKDVVFNPIINTTKGVVKDIDKAITAKFISLFYIADPQSGKYIELKKGDTLKKFQGFFVKAGGDNMQLIFNPETE